MAVFVIGAPRILRAISVAGTVQTLPLFTLRFSRSLAGSSLELMMNMSSSRLIPAVTGTVFSKCIVQNHYDVWVVDRAVQPDWFSADSGESCYGAPIRSGPNSGKDWMYLPSARAVRASSSLAVHAPCPPLPCHLNSSMVFKTFPSLKCFPK